MSPKCSKIKHAYMYGDEKKQLKLYDNENRLY